MQATDYSPPGATEIAAGTRDAVKVYGAGDNEVRALDGVSVGFAKGRWTAIMGPSGSGKSTLMHCVAGLDELTSGSVFIGDVDLACTLNRSHDLDGAFHRRMAPGTDDVAHAALRACLASGEGRQRTLAGLASPALADVQAAQAYLRHHPITDPAELRSVAEAIAAMAPSDAQAHAVESLGRLYLSDRSVLNRLVRLYADTPSPAVQAAVAGTLLRADPRVIHAASGSDRAELLRLLREQRRPSGNGGMIDALIRQLENS